MSYGCMSIVDLVNEFNILVTNMMGLAQQGQKLHELVVNRQFGEEIRSDIFRQLSNRAKFMERKKAEMLSTVEDSLAELELEKTQIEKYVELLARRHRRALARLEEVELLKKKLTSLLVASRECSVQLGEQLLVVEGFEQANSGRPEQLMGSILQKLAEFAEREKLSEMSRKSELDF
ncbi:MAG: hypothetical protein JTT11_04500 [Candidatus Brockarchaeota archaeon]|nr:hypothetical protein [Candidatus Brockarchaeota archaeon]